MSSRSRNRAIVGFGSQASAGTSGSSRNQRSQENEEDGSARVISDNTDMLINSALRYVLMQENHNKPVARIDIQKFLTEHHMVDKAALNLIMDEV